MRQNLGIKAPRGIGWITNPKRFAYNKVYNKTLTSLSEELPLDLFIRIHKSYTIAIDKVKFIEGNRIQIHSYTIPIGRNYSKDVKNRILE